MRGVGFGRVRPHYGKTVGNMVRNILNNSWGRSSLELMTPLFEKVFDNVINIYLGGNGFNFNIVTNGVTSFGLLPMVLRALDESFYNSSSNTAALL